MVRNANHKTVRTPGLQGQVRREHRRRACVFFFFAFAVVAVLSYSLFFGEMGVRKYLELRDNKVGLEKDIARLDRENNVMKEHVDSLKKDPYAIEKYAREEYGLAKPDEVIFQIKKKEKKDRQE
jgi:cell division protein FtsB